MTLHYLHPSLQSIDLGEFYSLYGPEAFENYLRSQDIEIQSKRSTRNHHMRRYSHQQIARVWQGYVDFFLQAPEINLIQIIRNYKREGTSIDQKKQICLRLFQLGLSKSSLTDMSIEALELGIAFILGDSMVSGESLVQTFDISRQVDEILGGKGGLSEESTRQVL